MLHAFQRRALIVIMSASRLCFSRLARGESLHIASKSCELPPSSWTQPQQVTHDVLNIT